MASARQASAHIFMSDARFAELVAKGVLTKAAKNAYDLDALREQYIEHLRKTASGRAEKKVGKAGLDLNDEKAKLAQAQTEEKVFKNALARGEYVKIKVAGQVLEKAVSISREKILSQIGVIAPMLASQEHPLGECEDVLRDRLYEAMDELSNVTEADFGQIDDDDEGDGAGFERVETSV